MARKPDTVCAGTCGQLIYSGKGCLPSGQAMCQSCRRERRQLALPADSRMLCPGCGESFELIVLPSGRARKTCSDRCRYRVMLRARAATQTPRARHRCEVCYEEYRYTYSGQRTCGRTCGLLLRQRSVRTYWCEGCGNSSECPSTTRRRFCSEACRPAPCPRSRICRECGSSFVVGTGSFCSHPCSTAARIRYNREYNLRRPRKESPTDWSTRTCPRCSELFDPTYALQKYCGPQCAKAAKRKRERASGVRYNGHLHRHRARKFGRQYVPIKPLAIFNRDGWVCQICLKRVPRSKKAPHPLSPTLDHIIPMSKPGGDHLYTNVRLAHFRCNWERGADDDSPVQLLLIG